MLTKRYTTAYFTLICRSDLRKQAHRVLPKQGGEKRDGRREIFPPLPYRLAYLLKRKGKHKAEGKVTVRVAKK